MKILLLNIDSKLPNLALKKIEMWHQRQGDEVIWDMPMMLNQADRAYASCIFTKNRHRVDNLLGLGSDLVVGGTGCDHTIKLPIEIEGMKPKINYGFTTRGCIRHCPFCLVPEAEGGIRVVGDIYDIWDGQKSHIILFDNNILALPEHFARICNQLIGENLAVDFNQGLDIRLLTKEACQLLSDVKLRSGVRFAFDFPELEPIIREKVALLRQYYNRKYIFFYVLVGYNTSFDQDLHRLNVLRELGCRPYVMRYETTPKERRYIRMAEWANQFWTFAKYDFPTFCQKYEEVH